MLLISKEKALKFLKEADFKAKLFSKDKKRKVGAIILENDSLIQLSCGYNGLPRKLKETKDKQFNCSFWWPGYGMRPPEFERARRAEKEIILELRREKLRNIRSQKDLKEKLIAQRQELENDVGIV